MTRGLDPDSCANSLRPLSDGLKRVSSESPRGAHDEKVLTLRVTDRFWSPSRMQQAKVKAEVKSNE